MPNNKMVIFLLDINTACLELEFFGETKLGNKNTKNGKIEKMEK